MLSASLLPVLRWRSNIESYTRTTFMSAQYGVIWQRGRNVTSLVEYENGFQGETDRQPDRQRIQTDIQTDGTDRRTHRDRKRGRDSRHLSSCDNVNAVVLWTTFVHTIG